MARTSSKDVLDKFRFKVTVEGTVIGFQTCQLPKRTTSKIIYREGIDTDIQFNSAGISTMEDITLSKGVISSASPFYNWIRQVHSPDTAGEPGGVYTTGNGQPDRNVYRKQITIEMLNRQGTTQKKWIVYNAFPIQYTPGSDLDASADDAKAIASLTLAYDDFREEL